MSKGSASNNSYFIPINFNLRFEKNIYKVKFIEIFLSDDNVKHVKHNIHMLSKKYNIDAMDVKKRMTDYAIRHNFNDKSASNLLTETLDYYNKQFTKDYITDYSRQIKNVINNYDDLISDVAPRDLTRFETMDDYRLADVWQDGSVFTDNYNSRKRNGIKGMNNPHVIGMHRRNIETDISESLNYVEAINDNRSHAKEMMDELLYDNQYNI